MIFEIIQVIEYLWFVKNESLFRLVPVYILAVFSTILVICFISFFHCEYRRQRKDEIVHSAMPVPTDPEATWTIEKNIYNTYTNFCFIYPR